MNSGLQKKAGANDETGVIHQLASRTQWSNYKVPEKAVLGSRNGNGGDTDMAERIACHEHECSPIQLAKMDLWLWARALNGAGATIDGMATGGLNSPSACIYGPAGGGSGIYTVVIAWRGVVERDPNGVHPCGQGRGLYGAPGSSETSRGSGDASYQRALVVQTYIAVP